MNKLLSKFVISNRVDGTVFITLAVKDTDKGGSTEKKYVVDSISVLHEQGKFIVTFNLLCRLRFIPHSKNFIDNQDWNTLNEEQK